MGVNNRSDIRLRTKSTTPDETESFVIRGQVRVSCALSSVRASSMGRDRKGCELVIVFASLGPKWISLDELIAFRNNFFTDTTNQSRIGRNIDSG